MSAARATGMRPTGEATWFGQPRGLTVLFLTNMWETFSYYGMRALLVYYMTKELLIDQRTSSFIYGAYTAFAYFTPIFGGVIADRLLGKRRAVVIGASIMALGHFMMAFEPLFYAALATIALGNGFFLPSLPSQINDLYAADDPRRGWAYNVYYVGINIGGFLAPLVCGTLGEVYGWHYGFGAAGIGMLLGLVIYLAGGRYLPPEAPRGRAALLASGETGVAAVDGGGHAIGRITLLLVGVGIAVTLFRGAYEQVGNTIALWADTGVDRAAGGFIIPGSWFQALNPLLVILMTPFLLAWWRRRAERGRDDSPARRMAAGALIVSGAFALLGLAASFAGRGQAGWPWLALFFVILTYGELHILPTGLGLFARLAPPRLGATTVGSWFLVTFAGSLFAGWVGTFWTTLDRPAFFLVLAALGLAAAALLRGLDNASRLERPSPAS